MERLISFGFVFADECHSFLRADAKSFEAREGERRREGKLSRVEKRKKKQSRASIAARARALRRRLLSQPRRARIDQVPCSHVESERARGRSGRQVRVERESSGVGKENESEETRERGESPSPRSSSSQGWGPSRSLPRRLRPSLPFGTRSRLLLPA